MRLKTVLAILMLAACAAEKTTPPVIGTVTWEGQGYPISAADTDSNIWRVRYQGWWITCTRPNTSSCYWSLRNFLVSKQTPDIVGAQM